MSASAAKADVIDGHSYGGEGPGTEVESRLRLDDPARRSCSYCLEYAV